MAKKKQETRWRPPKFTEEVVQKLEEIFKIDWTVEEACSYAWIWRRTYYQWCEENKEFLHRMEQAQQYPFILARKKYIKWITSRNEKIAIDVSKDFLSKRDWRYSNKNTEIQKPYEPDKDEEDNKRLYEILKIKHERNNW